MTLNHDGRAYELGTGYGHIAIGVDDLAATLATLKEQGNEPEREQALPRQRGWLTTLFCQRSRLVQDRADRPFREMINSVRLRSEISRSCSLVSVPGG